MRWLVFLHRYLGIAAGWLLLAWCVSGVVMMYVAYPTLSFARYLALAPELDFSGCCDTRVSGLTADARISQFTVEMLLGQPTLRVVDELGRERTLALGTGRAVAPVDRDASLAIAAERAAHLEDTASGSGPRYLGAREVDQWTIAERRPGRALHRIALGDTAGTQWYVAEDGRIVQETTRRQRFWNRFGAVTHWIYPTLLRRHPAVWAQVVIWSSVAGVFLTGFGLYLGIARLRRRPAGRRSPFRDLMAWHHYAGLVFGVLTLTWVASGLLSMNPWGLLESGGGRAEARELAAAEMHGSDIERWLGAIAAREWSERPVMIRSAGLLGRPYLMIYGRNGTARRVEPATLRAAPPAATELAAAAHALARGRGIEAAGLLEREDAYYYRHHDDRPLPVYRVILADAAHTRYYVDPGSGALLAKIDPGARWYRWLFAAAHRLDFAAPARRRPLWDALMIGLLVGVTAVCFTGTYLAIRALRR